MACGKQYFHILDLTSQIFVLIHFVQMFPFSSVCSTINKQCCISCLHCPKSVRIPSFSNPYFPAVGSEKHRIRTFSRCIVLQSKTNDRFLYEIQHCCRALVNIEININIGRNDCMFLSCHSDVSEWIHTRLVWLNSWVFVYELGGCGLEPYWEKWFKITEYRHYWVLSLACFNPL